MAYRRSPARRAPARRAPARRYATARRAPVRRAPVRRRSVSRRPAARARGGVHTIKLVIQQPGSAGLVSPAQTGLLGAVAAPGKKTAKHGGGSN